MDKKSNQIKTKGAISWMANNPVAANILMIFLLVGGLFWGMQIKQEVFPEFTIDSVKISVTYPGASPDEIEKGIILPIEEAIQGLNGIDEVISTADEGIGTVRVNARIDFDVNKLYQDIKNEIDRIDSFPDEAEEPTVYIPTTKHEVITLILYGNQTDKVLREVAEDVRANLLADKGISQVELVGDKPLEISIEVKEDILLAYKLTIAQIADKVRKAAFDLPGGSLKTTSGEILVRVKERKDYKSEFENIPIITAKSGDIIRLKDIAVIKDGFEETDTEMLYNNMPAIGINVYRVGNQTPITVSDRVKANIEKLKHTLPKGINVDFVDDKSKIFKQRIELLVKNGYLGLILVFILLGIFLEAKLAFWVTMGIPISFLGSLLILPHFGVSINMISLFAFIITLGIVVDDAIVVGENIYSYREKGYSNFEASVKGVKEVAIPVTFSILTNIITFMPLYFVPGIMGKFFKTIPVVVASVFIISLVEALFILPAHLAHQKNSKNRLLEFIHKKQQKLSNAIASFIKNIYGPFLKISLKFRYVTFSAAIILLIITVAYVKSGRIGITMFQKIESDFAYVTFDLPVGTPFKETNLVMQQLIQTAMEIINENGGEQLATGILSSVNKNTAWAKVYLTDPDVRPMGSGQFVKIWRKRVGDLPGIENISFQSDFGGPGSGAALTVKLSHRNLDVLEAASKDLANALRAFPIVSDIDDGFSNGKVQYDFVLNEEGYKLGLTPRELATQIRSNFYGAKALSQLRDRNEITVYVRLPKEERDTFKTLEDMMIITPTGGIVPLMSVADVKKGYAFTSITRIDGKRVIQVTADVTPQSKAAFILTSLRKDTFPELIKRYQGLEFSRGGKQKSMRDSMAALGKGMILSVLLVYVLLAIPFKSYIHPMIIMVSIPFGIIGAVIGHILMGFSLSILSMFGIVALSGVVVNDALVLIDFANRQVREGLKPYAAIVNAGINRFRPIILTTMTTFLGLTPMILEKSVQARFLIPMAISLAFGILFSTLIILVLVPALYIIIEDLKRLKNRILEFLF
jgi:multidrug efflux pump subunit AcrB